MTRLLVISLVALFATAIVADDKKPKEPITTIAVEKDDKVETKGGKATVPVAVRTAEDLKSVIPDEATRTRLAKLVDFKTHALLIFAWQGSGQDKIEYSVLESFPEKIAFTYTPGRTKDLRTHVLVYAVRSNVSWSVK